MSPRTRPQPVSIKRAYLPAEPGDGTRVLVDRLWPRGLSRERADIDHWIKEVAPSPELRKWWDHDPDRMAEFARRYRAELDENPAVQELLEIIRREPRVTLVYAARDEQVNHARVLAEHVAS